jgi:hypothetical protein
MKRLPLLLIALAAGLVVGLAVRWPANLFGLKPEVTSIADASLSAVQAQNRLIAFAARFTVDVTSTARMKIGLTAQKTMIVPGTVRYELDWAKLKRSDLAWNQATNTLTVTAPPVELSEPQVDLARIREYQDGRILMAISDAEAQMDSANRAQLREALLREARNPVLMRMARDATRAAVERTFALPLAAAGVPATVVVRFADEQK